MFKPGDEIVCVDDGWHCRPAPLKKGATYTVATIRDAAGIYRGLGKPSGLAAALVELPYWRDADGGWADSFDCSRFRKVQKRSTETGMAILKKIADKPNIKIKEDA